MIPTPKLAGPLGALLTASLAAAAPQSGTSFGIPSRPGLGGLPAPLNPEAVAAEDFDGDGIIDLFVVGRAGAKSVGGVALGISPTVYGPPAPVVPAAENAIPTLGDIDGDGDTDVCLITDGPMGRGITVFVNPSSVGSIPFPVPSVPYGASTLRPRLADADGDGDLDVFVRNPSGELVIYPWLGTGLGATPITTSVATNSSFEVFDLDGDGRADLLDPSNGSGLRLRPGTGVGFGAPQAAFGSSTIPAFDLRVLDLNGDGNLDVVVPRQTGSLAYLGDGTFGFTEAPLVPGQTGSTFLTGLADFTGDGVVDLVHIAGGPFPQPAESRWSSGPFPFAVGTPVNPVPIAPQNGTADVDGDGLVDVLTPGGFYRSSGSGTLFDELTPFSFGSGSPRSVAALDVDLDGDLDLVTIGQRADWRENDGDLDFEDVASLDLSPSIAAVDGIAGEWDAGGGETLITLEAVDLTSSIPSFNLRVYRPVGGGSLDLVHQIFTDLVAILGSAGELPRIVALEDFNLDGFSDVLVAAPGQYELHSGAPSFAFGAPARLNAGTDPSFGDLDGDGDLDLVASDGGSNILAWRTLLGFNVSMPVVIASVPGALSVKSGDMDGDGMDDVVVQTATDTFLIRRIGPFVFGAPERLYTALAPDAGRRIQLVDVDLDGALDVVLSPFSRVLSIGAMALLGDGQGGISSFVTVFDKVEAGEPEVFADLDGDGDLDAIGIDLSLGAEITTALIAENLDVRPIGAVACGAAALNSTGEAGRIRAFASDLAASGGPVRLRADMLPNDTFGIFVSSTELSAVPVTPPGSDGVLCLGGSIGRYSDPGQIGATRSTGSFDLVVDRSELRNSTGAIPAVAGQSWFFQAWYRDQLGGTPGSNLTGGVELRFE